VPVTLQAFSVSVTEPAIADLRRRLEATRWPDELPGLGWEYGIPVATVRDLCDYWHRDFDWDGFASRFNRFPQVIAQVGAERLHVIHARSASPEAVPVLLLHGWPGSVAEFLDVIAPLAQPGPDAFHVVVASLPGYGFGGPTTRVGINIQAVAKSLGEVMARLGYDKYLVQGGDWGAAVAAQMAAQSPANVTGIHLNLIRGGPADPDQPLAGLSEQDRQLVLATEEFRRVEMGYHALQSTKPQTLAYALMDSPAGLAAWILEKFHGWSDVGDDLVSVFSPDRLLDNISLYWLTGTIGSSMRLYKEASGSGLRNPPTVTVPTGYAAFPGERFRTPRPWAERFYPIVRWANMPKGGHFPAMQVPQLYVEEIRAFSSQLGR
jgi:epoxide hydrolase